MTKHKEKEEDIIKKEDAEHEEEIELADMELSAAKAPAADKSLADKKAGEESLPSEIPQSGSGEADISQGEKPAEAKDYEKLSEEYLNNWKRAAADFENYKKRQLEAQKDFAKFANMDLIMQILPVIDNFHASTDHIPEGQKNDPWVVGIMHIQKQLENILKENGVQEIEVAEGDEFTPHLHEAITNNSASSADKQETITKNKKNIIKKVLSKGYRIGERVIQPARVIVE